MTPLERADRSKELLDNVVFKQAFSAVEGDLIAKLKTVGFDDHLTQHELVLCLQLLGNVRRKVERWVEDGEAEKKKIAQDNWVARAKQAWRG